MSKTPTAFEDQFAKAGITARDQRFRVAIAEYFNNGGDAARGLMVYMRACLQNDGTISPEIQMAIEWLKLRCSYNPLSFAREIDEYAKGIQSFRHADGDALPRVAGSGQREVGKSPAAPGHARRGAAAIGSVQPVMSRSLFDTTVLPDGRTLRQVSWSECPTLAKQYRRLSRVLIAVYNHASPADTSSKLDDVVSEDQLKKIIDAVEVVNDVH